ncbi:MAG: CotH kinase family protein [Bacteroidia bacterium]
MKIKYFLTISIIIFSCGFLKAQTFTGTGDTIPDNGNSIDFTITASGLPNVVDTDNFGVETVCIDLIHTWDSDLDIYLVAPDGTQVLLTSANGGGDDNYTNTCFNYYATTPISQGTAPFTGTFKPQGQLGIVNNGQNPNGDWKLHVQDTYPFADYGVLFTWSIMFGTNPATAIIFTSSDLPIVVVNTNGQGIPNDPKITAHMGIIDNGPGMINHITDSFNGYNGFIGIEVRGSSSAGFPQKQYSIETRDSAGNNLDTVLLGMAADNDWILYAPYTDKSMMRNWLTYQLSNDMNRWAVKGKFCEMVLNGQYVGIYELTETIKQGNGRLDIAKLTLTDTTGDDLTGGYIVKIDRINGPYWASSYPPDPVNNTSNQMLYQCTYPKSQNILPVQYNYIQQYVDSFEDAMASVTFYNPVTGWRKYADEYSFIDYFILNELAKNVDGYRLSTFFFKDKDSNGGKIQMGPQWDFNLGWHNADYCNNEVTSGWAYRITDYCSADLSFWWKRLLLDGQYKNHLKCRWMTLRNTVLDTTYIFHEMDSIASLLDQAKDRHFQQWPILGSYVWPNPAPLANTYAEEIAQTKQWIIDRLAWMDVNLPGTCNPAGEEELFGTTEFMVYPVPAENLITINAFHLFNKNASVKIYDALGKEVMNENFETGNAGDDNFKLNISSLQNGIYFVNVFDSGVSIGVKKIVKL